MSFVRIRLNFQGPLPFSEVKNCWFLVDNSTCNTIADLEYLIKKRFKAVSKNCSSVDLFLDDYLLPSQEKIEIIQNNDNIRVEMKQATIKQDEESDDQATKKKAKSKKEDRHLPDQSNKSKRKQDDDNEEVFSETKKKRKKLPEKETQDGNTTKKNSKKVKKEKGSSQGSKNPVKEPKMEKAVRKKHKSSVRAVAASDDSSLLVQEKRKSTKTLALPSTSTVNAQLSKSSKPSKGKSKTEHKPINPSQRLSSKTDSGKRKSTSEPLKTNSKTSKTSANGKDLVTGKKAVDSDSSSSESSSSTESSSMSTDESGPSNSHSKVNGTLSPVTSPALINYTSKSPLHNSERLGKEVQYKTSIGSKSVKLPNGKESKDETVGTSKLSLFSHSSSKENGAVRASSPSSSSNFPVILRIGLGELTKSLWFPVVNSKGNGAVRASSSSSKSSSDTDSFSNLSSGNGKSKNAITKDARLSSSSSSLSPLLSSSSGKNKKDEGKLENRKKTSSLLLQPMLLSSPSSLSSPVALRRIQTENTSETSVNQSTMSSFTEKTTPLKQKQAQQSTSRRQNKRPDSSLSTSHIRFDSEESEEETDEDQSKVCSVKDNTDDLNSTQSSSSTVASKQNHQTRSKNPVSELKEPAKRDYSACTPLHGPPRSNDKIAYKVLELSASYTPEVSNYKEGTVLNFDPSSGAIKIELTKESMKKSQGDGNVTGKFELVYDESEENAENEEEDSEVVVLWSSMIEPVLIN
ncbi:hypothetical protein ACROYT_G037748 [Oculina patagonica]